VKRTGRDKPVAVVIHICMETIQVIYLYSYLYLKVAKRPCFSYYLLCFFFHKMAEQEGRTGSAQGGVWQWWEGARQWGKGSDDE
jgi:hypothetical protein